MGADSVRGGDGIMLGVGVDSLVDGAIALPHDQAGCSQCLSAAVGGEVVLAKFLNVALHLRMPLCYRSASLMPKD